MKALADDQHTIPKLNTSDTRISKPVRPVLQPCSGRSGIVAGMEQCRHQMGLTEATFANHNDRATLVRADRFNTLQKVMRRVRNLQKVLCRHLRGACIRLVGQLYCRSFEATPLEFLP